MTVYSLIKGSSEFSSESEEGRFEAVDGGPTKVEARSLPTDAKDGQPGPGGT